MLPAQPSRTYDHHYLAPVGRRHPGLGHTARASRPMSRRHHGRPHYDAHRPADSSRRVAGVSPNPLNGASSGPLGGPTSDIPRAAAGPVPTPQGDRDPGPRPSGLPPGRPEPPRPPADRLAPDLSSPVDDAPAAPVTTSVDGARHAEGARHAGGAPLLNGGPQMNGAPLPNGVPHVNGAPHLNGAPLPAAGPDRNTQCTAPQLRRFIKSRPYIPMHELRRRFGIDGGDDDVTPVRLDPGWVYVGLPSREGSLLGDLLRAGEIGYELSLDPRTPIVIGVYPMRPIPRG
jgi:hypothetical protein